MPSPSYKIITAKGRGKTWFKSVEAQQKRVKITENYFISRYGAWFRPGAHGYTGELAEAGVFDGGDARGYLNAEGVSLHPVHAVHAELKKQMLVHIERAAALAKIIEEF